MADIRVTAKDRAELWLRALDLAYRHNLGLVGNDGSIKARAVIADRLVERAITGRWPDATELPK